MIARSLILMIALALGGSLASADPARRVAVDLRCVWSVDRAELLAALALELAGSGLEAAADDAGAELVVSLDAAPCETTAAIRIGVVARGARRRAAVVDPSELAPGARARSLALLIAELLAGVDSAPAIAPAAESPVTIDEPAASVERRAGVPSPSSAELAAAFTAIHMSRDNSTTGLRLTVGRELFGARWLRAAVDLGGDTTRVSAFDLVVGRAGAQLGVRFALNARVSLDAMARGELALARVSPTNPVDQSIDGRMWHLAYDRDWLRGLAGGAVFGAEVAISSWLAVRLEVEASAVVAAQQLTYDWMTGDDNVAPVPDAVIDALGSGVGLSFGVVIR